jgi:RNA polymerase sigma factor (sigma-70 family)
MAMSKSASSKTWVPARGEGGARDRDAQAHRRLIAALTRRFGVGRFALIEDAVQEAYLRAIEQWGANSPGDSQQGWLVRVAHNCVVDALRRDRRNMPFGDEHTPVADVPAYELDDELRLVFLCCHPALPRAAQIALTLKVAYAFTTEQIARAFLCNERTIAQRIVRAKQRLREERASFDIPAPDQLPSRLAPILDVVYQAFTEGYATTVGDEGIDEVLCRESRRLLTLITDDDRVTTPAAEGLRALFSFHVARLAARRSADGGLLLLHEQDRSRWDGSLISEGFEWLGRSARGETLSRFQVEAGIAACHAESTSHQTTDWSRILMLYDTLRSIAPSPVVDVNRALAVAMCRGAFAGLDELDAIPERDFVARYPHALAMYAELHASIGHMAEARVYLDRALEQRTSSSERTLLLRKRAALGPDHRSD